MVCFTLPEHEQSTLFEASSETLPDLFTTAPARDALRKPLDRQSPHQIRGSEAWTIEVSTSNARGRTPRERCNELQLWPPLISAMH